MRNPKCQALKCKSLSLTHIFEKNFRRQVAAAEKLIR